MFSIILIVTDRSDRYVETGVIQQALTSLYRLRGDYEVILVNHYPFHLCPRTTEYLRDVAKERTGTKLIEYDAWLGPTKAFNEAVTAASPRSEFFVFMSDDARIVDSDILFKMRQAFASNDSLGVLHPLSVFEDAWFFNFPDYYSGDEFRRRLSLLQSHQRALNEVDISPEEVERTIAIVTNRPHSVKSPFYTFPLTFAAIEKQAFDAIGGFDEKLFMAHENQDFALRAFLAGYEVGRLNNSYIDHRRLLFRSLNLGAKTVFDSSQKKRETTRRWAKRWGSRSAEQIFHEIQLGRRLYPWLRPALVFPRKIGEAIRGIRT